MAQPAAVPDARENRRHPRRKVMRRGVLVHAPSGRSFSCIIVDISMGGARLHLLGGDAPKNELTLVDVRAGSSHDLRVVWAACGVMGVAFEKNRSLLHP
jgi:c-di-GMP-binding flagellar brake protein YcgR